MRLEGKAALVSDGVQGMGAVRRILKTQLDS